MKTRLVVLALLVIFSSTLSGQQTSILTWDHPTTTVAQANAFTTTVVADGNIITAPRTCVQVGTTATCSVAIPLINNGQHVYRVSSIIGGVDHVAVLNMTWPVVAGQGNGPAGIRISIVTTVTIGSM